MVGSLAAASAVLVAVGLVHSGLGEYLIWRHVDRMEGFPVALGSDALAKGTVRATWHIASALAWGLAAVLARLATADLGETERFVLGAIAASLFGSSAIAFVGTRARHPGWVAILVAAILCTVAWRDLG